MMSYCAESEPLYDGFELLLASQDLLRCTGRFLTAAKGRQDISLLPSGPQEELRRVLTELTSNLSKCQAVAHSFHSRKPSIDAPQPNPHIEHDREPRQSTSGPASSNLQEERRLWSGFYNKTYHERLDLLSFVRPNIFKAAARPETKQSPTVGSPPSSPLSRPLGSTDGQENLFSLPVKLANLMVENCIGVLGVPLGLGLNFVIDGVYKVVPMAIEEPSVIAAASGGAKLIAGSGGFRTSYSGNIMTAQVHILDVPSLSEALLSLKKNKKEIIETADTFCLSMKRRGGGVRDCYARVVSEMDSAWYPPRQEDGLCQGQALEGLLVVHLDVDVCEAMGANVVNTVAEGISPLLAELTGGRCGLRILTNLSPERRASACFCVPLHQLSYKGVKGEEVAERILEAVTFARVDPYRACTHNKGIMNGIDAVCLATGQDFRALEAAAHAFACRSGRYSSLSSYRVAEVNGSKCLIGELELPVAVGSKGGAVQTHPGYRVSHEILRRPSAEELARTIVCVGLAQNFAAVRALAITGIQSGHMTLHARNIAVASGSPSSLVPEVCAYMLSRGTINQETANEYLKAHSLFAELKDKAGDHSPQDSPEKSTVQPSTLYIALPLPHLDQPISFNIAFETLNQQPVHLAIMPRQDKGKTPELQAQLLGDKGFVKLCTMFEVLDKLRIHWEGQDKRQALQRRNVMLQYKIKLTSILANVVLCRLIESCPSLSLRFIERILQFPSLIGLPHASRTTMFDELPRESPLTLGFPLLLSLLQIFEYLIDQEVESAILAEWLLGEQRNILVGLSRRCTEKMRSSDGAGSEWRSDPSSNPIEALQRMMAWHSKRWQATLFLLVDALALPESLLSSGHLLSVTEFGALLEWEGTLSRDLARWRRELNQPGTPNIFLFWCRLVQPNQPLTVEVCEARERQFRENANALVEEMETKISHKEKEPGGGTTPAVAFDVQSNLNHGRDIIREHYARDS